MKVLNGRLFCLSRTSHDRCHKLEITPGLNQNYLPRYGDYMITRFDSAPARILEKNDAEPKLFEKVFPDPLQKQTFRPTSVDVDALLQTEWVGSGLLPEDLNEISKTAGAKGDIRKQQTADFLFEHFDDVSKLSTSGGDKIANGDLEIYQKMLKANELSPDPNKPNIEAWRDAHFDHESKGIVLPVIGAALGLNFGAGAYSAVMKDPTVRTEFRGLIKTNPRTALVAAAGGLAAALVGPLVAGAKGGEWLNKQVGGAATTRHFYDEAAPAMKRLMEG